MKLLIVVLLLAYCSLEACAQRTVVDPLLEWIFTVSCLPIETSHTGLNFTSVEAGDTWLTSVSGIGNYNTRKKKKHLIFANYHFQMNVLV
jgi:hypothetical protein